MKLKKWNQLRKSTAQSKVCSGKGQHETLVVIFSVWDLTRFFHIDFVFSAFLLRNGGLQLEDFECLSVLGRGHFGKVHHNSQLVLGRCFFFTVTAWRDAPCLPCFPSCLLWKCVFTAVPFAPLSRCCSQNTRSREISMQSKPWRKQTLYPATKWTGGRAGEKNVSKCKKTLWLWGTWCLESEQWAEHGFTLWSEKEETSLNATVMRQKPGAEVTAAVVIHTAKEHQCLQEGTDT